MLSSFPATSDVGFFSSFLFQLAPSQQTWGRPFLQNFLFSNLSSNMQFLTYLTFYECPLSCMRIESTPQSLRFVLECNFAFVSCLSILINCILMNSSLCLIRISLACLKHDLILSTSCLPNYGFWCEIALLHQHI